MKMLAATIVIYLAFKNKDQFLNNCLLDVCNLIYLCISLEKFQQEKKLGLHTI